MNTEERSKLVDDLKAQAFMLSIAELVQALESMGSAELSPADALQRAVYYSVYAQRFGDAEAWDLIERIRRGLTPPILH